MASDSTGHPRPQAVYRPSGVPVRPVRLFDSVQLWGAAAKAASGTPVSPGTLD
jgi:hypothetical protein